MVNVKRKSKSHSFLWLQLIVLLVFSPLFFCSSRYYYLIQSLFIFIFVQKRVEFVVVIYCPCTRRVLWISTAVSFIITLLLKTSVHEEEKTNKKIIQFTLSLLLYLVRRRWFSDHCFKLSGVGLLSRLRRKLLTSSDGILRVPYRRADVGSKQWLHCQCSPLQKMGNQYPCYCYYYH